MKNTWIMLVGGAVIIAVLSYLLNTGIFKHAPAQSADTKSLQIVTSFYPMYFFTSQMVGNKADVLNITPSGAEPHDYEPTAQDIAHIETSNLLILNGGKLEPWGEKIKSDLQGKQVTIVTAGEGLANQQIEEEGETIQDPHIWLSPPLAKQEIKAILEGLIKVDPQNKDYYTANADTLLQNIDQLDQEYKTGLSSCSQKSFVTSHAAFGYLAKNYGINQIAISGVSPDEEPSSQKLAQIADFAKKNNVKYIFFESLVSPKLSETIANEIGAKTLVLDPIEGISDKDMKAGKNYITIMKDNLTNLRLALACK